MSEWTVDIIEVGVIPDLPLNLYIPDATDESRLDVPCYCYLLSQGGRAVLVDSGPDPIQAANAGFAIRGDPRRSLLAALRYRHLVPDDIETIIHTHLHYDHMQNDDLFDRSTVLVQRAEVEWTSSSEAGRFYVGVDAWLDRTGERIRMLSGESTPHSGVTLLLNGGHSPGHQSVRVDTEDGTVCLCADIIPLAHNRNVVPGVCWDVAATRRFQRRAAEAGWELIPGHEPELRRHRWYANTKARGSEDEVATTDADVTRASVGAVEGVEAPRSE